MTMNLSDKNMQIDTKALQSEHCKGLILRISARAFTRLQKIVQCECSLNAQIQVTAHAAHISDYYNY